MTDINPSREGKKNALYCRRSSNSIDYHIPLSSLFAFVSNIGGRYPVGEISRKLAAKVSRK